MNFFAHNPQTQFIVYSHWVGNKRKVYSVKKWPAGESALFLSLSLCYSTANVVESSYGLDNLEVTNHANSSMENDVMMLMQLATCKLCFCFCQFSFIYLVNKTCKRKTKYVGIIRRRILLVCHLPFFDRQSDI